MICSKGQTVQLTITALLLSECSPDNYGPDRHARVQSVVESDGNPGERRVQLDRRLAGERWWVEDDLEPVV